MASCTTYFCKMVSYIKRRTQPKDTLKNKILRRIFGPEKNENREWRRLHSEDLHIFYRSPNIIRLIKCKRLRWAGHV